MNEERVERLEALLSRVQENRKRARTPAGLGLLKPEPAKPVHSVHTQTAAGLMPAQPPAAAPVSVAPPEPARPIARPAPQPFTAPAARSAAPPPSKLQMPVRPAAPEPTPVARPAAAAVEPAPSRRAAQAGATPLEMAVAELEMGAGAKAEARREPPAAAAPAPAPLAPPISPDEAFEPVRIEPDPIREAARPIAQVVSRHSPQVDATFGAMLKRSLSLRPH